MENIYGLMSENTSHITFSDFIRALDEPDKLRELANKIQHEKVEDEALMGVKVFLEQNDRDIDKLRTFLSEGKSDFQSRVYSKTVSKSGYPMFMRIAASLLVVVFIASLFYWFAPSKTDRLYSGYYEKEMGLPVVLDHESDKLFDEAMNAFRDDDFEAAKTGFIAASKKGEREEEIAYFIACSAMELQEWEVAEKRFLAAISHDGEYRDKAEYRLVLVYIKQGDFEAAQSLLQQMSARPTHRYYEEARGLLEEL